jgi:hypothetical protein
LAAAGTLAVGWPIVSSLGRSLPQLHARLVAVGELDAGGLEGGAHSRNRLVGDRDLSLTLHSLDGRQGQACRLRDVYLRQLREMAPGANLGC